MIDEDTKKKVIDMLEKDRKWGCQTRVGKTLGIKQHTVSRINNVIKVRKKLKELYFNKKYQIKEELKEKVRLLDA